jgi:hypothetical protein
MAAEYDEYEEEEAPAPKKPKRPRKPIDWPLMIMLVGSAVFLLAFALITVMAPRRPFLLLRSAQQVKPAVTAAAGAAGGAAASPVASPAATPAAKP